MFRHFAMYTMNTNTPALVHPTNVITNVIHPQHFDVLSKLSVQLPIALDTTN
mgnify:CR=1 FL=1